MTHEISKAKEYKEWLKTQTKKDKWQIEERLDDIEQDDHFGYHRPGKIIWELKWKNGRRLYFAYIGAKKIALLWGGNKNGQKKDFTKAAKALQNLCS